MRFDTKEIQVFIFEAGQLPLNSHSQIIPEYDTAKKYMLIELLQIDIPISNFGIFDINLKSLQLIIE